MPRGCDFLKGGKPATKTKCNEKLTDNYFKKSKATKEESKKKKEESKKK
ncbi:hypothetical protein TetV_544 [Tetraselmis virus 1]|uniref:Uncharacterized protein n=1 Tax=Tetraselmis virus 1 TaxID=2060617 RepID=A0A2P0VNY6_9VIRU|nr:hypothetical protein QJ968_gp510 [Tetraselmis virus 1]AUF82626.1 hypothetical protein TetV_544 [Tetraselmis virus 1]